MEFDLLHIFTHHGCTYTFMNGVITSNNETTLQFDYRAMSDGNHKTATFPKRNIAGWTIMATQSKPE